MSNKENKDKKDLGKFPKFNSYWIYGIALALLLGFQFVKGVKSFYDFRCPYLCDVKHNDLQKRF